jgi:hypothetical protein
MSVTDGRLKGDTSVCPVAYYAVPVMCNLFNANLKTSRHKGTIYMQATEKLKYTDSFIVYFIKNTYE